MLLGEIRNLYLPRASLVFQTVKCLPAMQETQVWSLGQEDPLEKEIATHSSTLAWKIQWVEKPGSLQSMWSQRVGHDLHDFHFHTYPEINLSDEGLTRGTRGNYWQWHTHSLLWAPWFPTPRLVSSWAFWLQEVARSHCPFTIGCNVA